MRPSLLLVLALGLAGCETLENASYNPANWQLQPDAPPSAPTPRPARSSDGIASLSDKPGARLWIAETGSTAKAMMAQWAQTAGYTLLWQASVDRRITVGASVYGTFEEAVTTVFNAGFQGPPALTPIFSHGNRVLRITQDGTLGQ